MEKIEVLSPENPLFRAYAFYSCILIMKMLFMSYFTGKIRRQKKVAANPEDLKLIEGLVIKFDDPDVERARRAHLNDLENIIPFLTIAFCYILTNPNLVLATNLFRVFTIARILHTFVYTIVVIPQPSRALAHVVAIGVSAYMCFATISNFVL